MLLVQKNTPTPHPQQTLTYQECGVLWGGGGMPDAFSLSLFCTESLWYCPEREDVCYSRVTVYVCVCVCVTE